MSVFEANVIELSKYIWRCKNAGLNPTVSWEIVRHAPAYNSGNRERQLCSEEKNQILVSNSANTLKYQILVSNSANTLNKRSEIINKCRHRTKFKLKNIKRNAF